MGRLTSIIPEKNLNSEYTSAKIIASPYNYKLSDRLIIYDSKYCCDYFNIYIKENGTEQYLADVLGLKEEDVYLNPNKDIQIDLTSAPALSNVSDNLWLCDKQLGTIGALIKYNNLIVNEDILLQDMQYITGRAKDIYDKKYLKALEIIHLMGYDTSSLIPNLMYLCTEYSDRSLDDMENIVFAKEFMESGNAPIIDNCRQHEPGDLLAGNMLFSAAVVPFNSNLPTYTANPGYAGDTAYLMETNNNLLLLGLIYSIIYGTELLYCYNNIKDTDIKSTLEDLFKVGFKEDSFCTKYLYFYDKDGNFVINPGVESCFDTNNEKRFENIRNMLKTLVTLPDFGDKEIAKNLDWFAIPLFFARTVMAMHGYAYQVARIKHGVLLYKTAKDKGVINKEDFNAEVTGGLSIFGSDEDDCEDPINNELIDLDTFSTGPDTPTSLEDSIEKEKSVTKKHKETPPALSAADMLKKDLQDSDYEFDINYVKNEIANKDAYNTIAAGVKMISHELTRQIKDIKTYNTGGKQGGLLTGKLDKKNLYKYKSDPHIFCNNNYKLKEMDLAFGCILDESGSMWGEKVKNGRIVMIMLHKVLNSLGINHSIIGHTSSGMYNTKIYKYFQFKEESHYSLEEPYGLVKAEARNGNCDSGALYYMQSVMKTVRNKDKIVIIFSDGQPTECTDLDLTEQVKNMERHGIHVIGVGINFESIKNYYPDNANGRNLKEMVDIVVSILKRYVLEKKED